MAVISRNRFGVACAITLLMIATAAAPVSSRASDADKSLPVILLTGFEPFGPQKPPNPSWEGIKKLDGRTWRGHKLAARQMKVVWGTPLVQLQKLIDELHPVAVFAFGQGGDFALETRARNARGAIEDNNGALPPSPEVIDGGPAEFKTLLNSKAVLAALKSKGYEARLSSNAGAYLCEEMLYTLEHLKAEGQVSLAVSFCHLPPLNTPGPSGPVTAAYVQQFVEDYLDAWLATTADVQVRGQSPDAAPAEAANKQDKQEKEVREFIDRYFRTWSTQDMDRYGQCFMPQAVVQMIDGNGRLVAMPLTPFLRSQQESHRQAAAPMTETPEKIAIRFDANLAHVLVYWKLVATGRVEYGYDHFTLMRSDGKWRIAHLIFYTDAEAKQRQ